MSVTSASDASSSTRKGELPTTGRDSDTTIEENEKVRSSKRKVTNKNNYTVKRQYFPSEKKY